MAKYGKLPRKIKKQLKKNPLEWEQYKENVKIMKERHENLDIIFTRDYKNGRKIFRRSLSIGKL